MPIGAAEQEEIKKGFESIKTELKTYQDENDKRLKEIEKKGSASGETEQKLKRIDEVLHKLEERQEKIQTVLNRAPEGKGKEEESNEIKTRRQEIMHKLFKKGENALSLEEREFYTKNYSEAERKFLSVGSDPDGGYLVTPEMSSEIGKKLFETSPMRQECSVIQISSDAFEELADYDEVDVERGNEVSTRSTTDASQLSKIRIPVHEMYAKPKATQQLLEDAGMNVESWLQGKVADKFSRTENTDFVSGSGVGRAKGFLSYTNADAFDGVEQVASAATSGIDADDLIKLQDTLYEPYQNGAIWVARRMTVSEFRKLKDGNGRYLLDQEGNLAEGYHSVILGNRVVKMADMPAMGAANLPLAYGNFKVGYLIVDRIGMSLLRDPYSAKPFVEFYFRKRSGGGVRNFQAIKVMSQTNA